MQSHSENQQDGPKEHGFGRVKFDPTINLGHIATGAVFIASTVAAWISLSVSTSSRLDQHEKDIIRIERDNRDGAKRIEAVFTERLADEKSLIQSVSLSTAANIAEIKSAILRIDEKLDRKQDKPGR